MTMRVLVIPEDSLKDKFILDPIVKALLKSLEKPNAKVVVCPERLRGIGEAMKWERLSEIMERYPMMDLILLCVDRDGQSSRKAALDSLEEKARNSLPENAHFLAENAWQEIEVWALAGLDDLPKDWAWKDIREESNPKERFFDALAQHRGVASGPGGGRKALAEEAARRIDRIVALCPEDLGSLKTRIAAFA